MNRRDLGTPLESIESDAYRADRRWNPAPINNAFGESIYGAEASPLAAYLVGLVIVQAALATGVALLARRSGEAAMEPRLAGAAIAGIGIAILAGQFIPA